VEAMVQKLASSVSPPLPLDNDNNNHDDSGRASNGKKTNVLQINQFLYFFMQTKLIDSEED